MKTMPKITVLARWMNIDLPYLDTWLDYYHTFLGVEDFYLLYVNESPLPTSVISTKATYSITWKWFDPRRYQNANDVLQCVYLDLPPSSYLLHVDSDEFLYLDGLTLPQFIEQYSGTTANYFRFPWLMSPVPPLFGNIIFKSFYDIFYHPKIPKYFVTQYKSLCRVDLIDHKKPYHITPHDFDLVEKDSPIHTFTPKESNFFIIHFSFRSMYDAYLKCKYQHLMRRNIHQNQKFFHHPLSSFSIQTIPQRVLVYDGETHNACTPVTDLSTKYPHFPRSIKKIRVSDLFRLGNPYEFSIFQQNFMKIAQKQWFRDLVLHHAPKSEIISYLR